MNKNRILFGAALISAFSLLFGYSFVEGKGAPSEPGGFVVVEETAEFTLKSNKTADMLLIDTYVRPAQFLIKILPEQIEIRSGETKLLISKKGGPPILTSPEGTAILVIPPFGAAADKFLAEYRETLVALIQAGIHRQTMSFTVAYLSAIYTQIRPEDDEVLNMFFELTPYRLPSFGLCGPGSPGLLTSDTCLSNCSSAYQTCIAGCGDCCDCKTACATGYMSCVSSCMDSGSKDCFDFGKLRP